MLPTVSTEDRTDTLATGVSLRPTIAELPRAARTEPLHVERATSPEGQGPAAAQAIASGSPGASAGHQGGGVDPVFVEAPRALREQDLRVGALRLAQTLEASLLIANEGLSQKAAAKRVGVSEKDLSIWLRILRSKGESATAADFAPRHAFAGRRPAHGLTAAELAEARSRAARINRTRTAGSIPEGLRAAVREGALRPETVELMREREAAGLPLLPESATRLLGTSEPLVRAIRAPRNAGLEYISAPGSLHIVDDDDAAGGERMLQPGERWTIDDGSVNLVLIVPGLERPGDPCFDRWGVCVGRFQFLLCVDQRTRCIVGWSFTARPRDSYRAEDLTATLHNAMLEHGAPRGITLEHGVSAARLITDTMAAVGVKIHRSISPHSKVVESVFNLLWSKLSLLTGQVGRFRGEEEAVNLLLARIRGGSLDPRGQLLALPAVLSALRDTVAEFNRQWVSSERYGRWIPGEFYAAKSPAMLRRISPRDAWMFSPVITEPLTVQGFAVTTTVPLIPGHSIKFVFADESLVEISGRKVKLYFNPFAVDCIATAVLAEAAGPYQAGRVMGQLRQVDRLARFTRRAMGYGLDPDIGLEAARSHQQALRRHVQATRPDGSVGVQSHEIRTGDGQVQRAEMPGARSTTPEPERAARPAPRAVQPEAVDRNSALSDPRLREFLADEDDE